MSAPCRPVLYSFRRCPYAMRARMALMTAAIDCELREVVLRNKPVQMTALSPKATVPVLHLSDGTVIDESIDIMHWALAQHDPHGWLDADAHRTGQLIARNDTAFKDALDRYKYFVNWPEQPQRHWRECGEVFLDELEQQLAANDAAGLLTARTTLADVAIFPFVRQFARVDWPWFENSRYRRLAQWLDAHEHSALFVTVMKKYPPWKDGDPLTVFGAGSVAAR